MNVLYHPAGSIMRFKSEEDKLNFLGLMIKQRYPLFNWFIKYHIGGMIRAKELKKRRKELLFYIHLHKKEQKECF